MTAATAVLLYLLGRLDERLRARNLPRSQHLPESNVAWLAHGYPARLRYAVRRIPMLGPKPRKVRDVAAFLGCSLPDLDLLIKAGLFVRFRL